MQLFSQSRLYFFVSRSITVPLCVGAHGKCPLEGRTLLRPCHTGAGRYPDVNRFRALTPFLFVGAIPRDCPFRVIPAQAGIQMWHNRPGCVNSLAIPLDPDTISPMAKKKKEDSSKLPAGRPSALVDTRVIYCDFMRPRCVQLHRVLKPTGSFYYHCDWHAKPFSDSSRDFPSHFTQILDIMSLT